MNTQTCCAHCKVILKHIDTPGGCRSDYWECSDDCGEKFVPISALKDANSKIEALEKTISENISQLVDRFLMWPLPDSVCADLCATRQGSGRVGTNLLSAVEARQMFEYLFSQQRNGTKP